MLIESCLWGDYFKGGGGGGLVSQLGVRVSLLSGIEGDGQEVGVKRAVEDAVTIVSVIVDGLVDDIPGIALSFIMAHHVADVVVDDGFESGPSPAAGCDWKSISKDGTSLGHPRHVKD